MHSHLFISQTFYQCTKNYIIAALVLCHIEENKNYEVVPPHAALRSSEEIKEKEWVYHAGLHPLSSIALVAYWRGWVVAVVLLLVVVVVDGGKWWC